MKSAIKYPQKLIFTPHVSLGPLIIGAEKENVMKIMKEKFGCDPDEFEKDRVLYPELHVILDFDKNKLMFITIFDSPNNKIFEIMYEDKKIWPRRKNFFLNMFQDENIFELNGCYYHPDLDFSVQWYERPYSLVIAPDGYSIECLESDILTHYLLTLKKGMKRNIIRKNMYEILEKDPNVSSDSKKDCYKSGEICLETTCLTYDKNDNLIKAVQILGNNVLDYLD